MFQMVTLPAVIVAIVFGLPPLRYKFSHPSLQAGLFGWTVLLLTILITQTGEQRTELIAAYIGISCLAVAVLLKSVRFHKRNAHFFESDDEEADTEDVVEPEPIGSKR